MAIYKLLIRRGESGPLVIPGWSPPEKGDIRRAPKGAFHCTVPELDVGARMM